MSNNSKYNTNDAASKLVDTLIHEVLEGKSESFKRKVLSFVTSCGLSPEDPLLLLLIATGSLEKTLEDAPQALNIHIKTWIKQLSTTLDQIEGVSIQRQQIAVTRAAQELVKETIVNTTTDFKGSRNLLGMGIVGGLLAILILWIGVCIGATIPVAAREFLGAGYSKTQVDKLTNEEYDAMRWAISKEGKFARNLIDWNRGYLDNGACVADAKRLGISLSDYGREASSGFCIVWAIPPNQRKFEAK